MRTVEVPDGATVLIWQATAEAEVIKAADIAAAAAASTESEE
jgi:hypothetical protein